MSLSVTARDAREWLHQARYGGLRTVTAEEVTERLVDALDVDSAKNCNISDEDRTDGVDCDFESACPACALAETKRQLDCGMSSERRAWGGACPVSMPNDSDEDDCAACALFALRRLADCSPDRDRPAVCGSGVEPCLACQLARAKEVAAELDEGGMADKVAALEKQLATLAAEHEERLDAAMRDVRAARAHAIDIAPEVNAALVEEARSLRAELSLVREERNRFMLEAQRAPTPVRRPRVPRPGEVSLFDLVRPGPGASGDLVVPVTEDAPPQVRTAGRSCGCQARGRHRRECSKRVGAAGGVE